MSLSLLKVDFNLFFLLRCLGQLPQLFLSALWAYFNRQILPYFVLLISRKLLFLGTQSMYISSLKVFGSVRSSGSQSVSLSVRPSLSKALNLHLSLIGQSQVSLRAVSCQSQVSLRAVSCQSQVSLRSLCAYFVRKTEPKILRLVFMFLTLKIISCL